MADSVAAPRRSQRDRKQVKPFASCTCSPWLLSSSPQPKTASQSPNKRKIVHEDDSLTELSDVDDNVDDHADADAEQEEDEEDFSAAKPKKRAAPPRKPKGPPPAKKQRTTKSTTAPPKPKQRRTKAKAVNGHFDPTKLAADTKIAADNALFSTSSPVRSTASPVNLHRRHLAESFRRSSIHRGRLPPLTLTKCRTSTG